MATTDDLKPGDVLTLDRSLEGVPPSPYVIHTITDDYAYLGQVAADAAGEFRATGRVVRVPLVTLSQFQHTGTSVKIAE